MQSQQLLNVFCGRINTYRTDHLGSIREVVGAEGSLVARWDYDAWGVPDLVIGTFDLDFKFTGHFFHSPSEMHLAPYRAYDANLGRWISRDPITEQGGINLYAYCLNDPINGFDPYGLCTVGLGFKGSISALLGADGSIMVTKSFNGWNPLDWRLGYSAYGGGSLGTGYGGWAGIGYMIAPYANQVEDLNGFGGGAGCSVSFAGLVVAADVTGATPNTFSPKDHLNDPRDDPSIRSLAVSGAVGIGTEITGPPNVISGEAHITLGYTYGKSYSPREIFNTIRDYFRR